MKNKLIFIAFLLLIIIAGMLRMNNDTNNITNTEEETVVREELKPIAGPPPTVEVKTAYAECEVSIPVE